MTDRFPDESAAEPLVQRAAEAAEDDAEEFAADPAAMRAHYRAEGLDEADLAPHPMDQFARWFNQAAQAAMHGFVHEPNAMVVATADAEGLPAHARCC